MQRSRQRVAIWISLFTLLLAGCGRDEEIRAYSAPKAARPVQEHAPAPAAARETVHWELPEGWRQLPGEGMRFATLILEEGSEPGGKPLELRVTPLGLFAGDPLANVNRWREQIGLEHITAEALDSVAHEIEVDGRPTHIVSMRGSERGDEPPLGILAAILPGDQFSWFFLVLDSADRVAPYESAFEQFVGGVTVVAGQQAASASLPAGHPPVDSGAGAADAPPAGGDAAIAWTAPPGWEERPGNGSFRVVSFAVADAQGNAEVAITRFPGDVGGLLANINRWRRQLGLAPVSDVSEQPLESMQVDAMPAQMVDLLGTGSDNDTRQRMLVVLVAHEGLTWFLKMTGPNAVLEKQKGTFLEFTRSVQFAPEQS
ncbi:MAG: hypothetical protein JSW67_13440 [Candidatus Latescibacterota bacterium]|nr:MAG: hypothetical protein JSW67_13440 [Candidatus Latescibacterota bacterium]